MSKKIAPTLRYAFPRPLSPREVMTGVRRESVRTYNGADAYRELHALLALERAVRRWRCNHPGGLTADEERIVTAHERLTRVNGGTK